MKRFVVFLALAGLLSVWLAGCASAATVTPAPTATAVPPTPTLSIQDVVGRLHWFGTSAFLYRGSKVIYFDPVSLEGDLPPADLILVTHGHSDHWTAADLQKVTGPNTALVVSPNVPIEASQAEISLTPTVLKEGEKIDVDGVGVEAVPAYDTSFHQKGSGGVGYIVSVDGQRIYIAGGTDAYPEMAQYQCDIALIPAYSRNQAKALAQIIPTKAVILEHTSYYGAAALATIFEQEIGSEKTFVALTEGPYQP